MIMITENVKRSMIPYGMIEGFVPTLETGGVGAEGLDPNSLLEFEQAKVVRNFRAFQYRGGASGSAPGLGGRKRRFLGGGP